MAFMFCCCGAGDQDNTVVIFIFQAEKRLMLRSLARVVQWTGGTGAGDHGENDNALD